jgi:peptidoglycan/LPS O-acetylase OafA/YrhL
MPQRRWPALDGMRGIAVLAVILYHVGVLAGGYLGVDVFFVLSGFLITSWLIGEWDARGGRVSLPDFYARRVLRLFPALGCVILAALVFAGCLAMTSGSGERSYALITLHSVPWVLAFAGNWVRAFGSPPLTHSLGVLGHTWSLAVEEQFYLLWPLLFVLLMRRRISRDRLALALGVLAVAEMVYRGWLAGLGTSQNRIYYATDTHSDGLLIGCALAFWLARRNAGPDSPGRARTALGWLAGIVLSALLMVGSRMGGPVETSLAVLASGVLVAGIVAGGAPAGVLRVLRSRSLVLVGRRSYGLYLWQYILLAAAEALCSEAGVSRLGPVQSRVVFAAAMAAGVVATFGVAELSYKYVELPALRLKRRFRWADVVEGGPDGETDAAKRSVGPLVSF